jgi:transcriptional regulator with XRE-family HTH domain
MRKVVPKPFPDPRIRKSSDVGAAVRAARTQANLTLRDAAQILGVAIQTLSDIEAGKPSVGLGKVLQVADGLGLDFFALPKRHRSAAERRLTDLPP